MKWLLLIATLIPLLSFAQDAPAKIRFEKLTLTDGKVLEQVRIREVGVDYVSIIHSEGAGKIPYDKLLPADAADLGLKKEAIDSLRAEKATVEASKKESQEKDAKIKQILDLHFRNISGKIIQVFPDGVLVSDCKIWGGLYSKTILKDQIIYLASHESEGTTCRIFCDMNRHRYVDGDTFWDAVTRSENYTYTNTLGSTSTVRAFTTDFSRVLDDVAKDIPRPTILEAIRDQYSMPKLSYIVKLPASP